MIMNFSELFLNESIEIIKSINKNDIEKIVDILLETKINKGRLFIIGSGGGAGHASHAVCDFRKICNIDAYTPYDNVSELTARVNDEGWETTIINNLKISNLNKNDTIFVFSVGGGDKDNNISENIVFALEYAKKIKTKIVGIVGRDGGYTKKIGDSVLVIPTINDNRITPHTEGFQSIIWHLIVSHPKLQINNTKWESIKKIK
jgi:D-sedoheptulose 7-phosphate isomerase